jgi:hypothetical protein
MFGGNRFNLILNKSTTVLCISSQMEGLNPLYINPSIAYHQSKVSISLSTSFDEFNEGLLTRLLMNQLCQLYVVVSSAACQERRQSSVDVKEERFFQMVRTQIKFSRIPQLHMFHESHDRDDQRRDDVVISRNRPRLLSHQGIHPSSDGYITHWRSSQN